MLMLNEDVKLFLSYEVDILQLVTVPADFCVLNFLRQVMTSKRLLGFKTSKWWCNINFKAKLFLLSESCRSLRQ